MKKKYKCETCQDTGYWSNPFDQRFKCDCQKKRRKKSDYRGFVLHLWEWQIKGIPYGVNDLIDLAKIYDCPIRKGVR